MNIKIQQIITIGIDETNLSILIDILKACQMHYNIISFDGCAYNVTVLNTINDQSKNTTEIN